MTLHDVSLSDRFDLSKRTVLLGGIQALVRMTLMQKARDAAAGHRTAGFVSGYRGSPLGGVDLQMMKAKRELAAADIKFEPGLNEDLAATALWGTQQAQLRGEGRVEGVFGLWYGKGPGVDRCGDVFRHANMAGTAAKGGVLVCMGDDHTGESSTDAAPFRVRAGRRDDADPVAGGGAGDPRLRPARLGAVALHRLLGGAEMRQGHHRGHRGGGRRPAPAGDRHAQGLRAARGRAEHPPARHAGRAGGAAARLQALRGGGLRAGEPDRPAGLGQGRARASASSPAASPGSTPSTRSTCSGSTPPRRSGWGSPPTRSAWSGRSTWPPSASGRRGCS